MERARQVVPMASTIAFGWDEDIDRLARESHVDWPLMDPWNYWILTVACAGTSFVRAFDGSYGRAPIDTMGRLSLFRAIHAGGVQVGSESDRFLKRFPSMDPSRVPMREWKRITEQRLSTALNDDMKFVGFTPPVQPVAVDMMVKSGLWVWLNVQERVASVDAPRLREKFIKQAGGMIWYEFQGQWEESQS